MLVGSNSWYGRSTRAHECAIGRRCSLLNSQTNVEIIPLRKYVMSCCPFTAADLHCLSASDLTRFRAPVPLSIRQASGWLVLVSAVVQTRGCQRLFQRPFETRILCTMNDNDKEKRRICRVKCLEIGFFCPMTSLAGPKFSSRHDLRWGRKARFWVRLGLPAKVREIGFAG